MKTLKYVLILFMGTMGLTSCEDFFDSTSSSSEDPAEVYNSAEQLELFMGAIYNEFGYDKSYRNRLCGGYVGNNTDIEYGNKSSGNAHYNNYTTGADGVDLSAKDSKDPWGYINAAITKANIIINNVDPEKIIVPEGGDVELEKAKLDYLKGEALTLRAFFYLELIKYWGDVPARFNDESDPNPPKADRNVIFEQLRKDLAEAVTLVPWSDEIPVSAARNHAGRVSKGYVYGLWAKVNLMYAGKGLRPDVWTGARTNAFGVQYNTRDATLRQELYEEVLEACKKVIEREDGKLKPTFADVFKTICQGVVAYNQTESMFEIDFKDNARGQMLNLLGLRSTNANDVLLNKGAASNNAMQYIVPTYVYDFEPGDERKWVTVAPFNWYKATAVAQSSDTGNNMYTGYLPDANAEDNILYPKISKINSFCLAKYRYEWMPRKIAANDDGLNLVLMRYSDILLMFAEAAIGGISGDRPANNTGLDGLEQLNKVRQRAGLAALPSYDMETIQKERAFEFCGENIRKYDLMRWGILGNKLTETMNRLAELNAHTGEFAETPTTEIYVKFKRNDALVDPNAPTQPNQPPYKGYEIDQIWGLSKGEHNPPADADAVDALGREWYKTKIFTETDDSAGEITLLSRDQYWLSGADGSSVNVDNRQLWPLFNMNTSVSAGALWNDGWVGNDNP